MGDQHESQYRDLPEQLQRNTIERSSVLASFFAGSSATSGDLGLPGDQLQWSMASRRSRASTSFSPFVRSEVGSRILSSNSLSRLGKLQKDLAERHSEPVTSISSFMAAMAAINPPFKPRTLHRPWSISAGHGAHGAVEVHRYVPGRNFNVFNDSSSLKLLAYEPDRQRTGDYYAVKRLVLLEPASAANATQSKRNPYALLADELRILAHPDLRGHPNIVYLFGVSHTPSRGGIDSAEPNLVLQEGDCGDLYSFYRDVDMRFNRHTLTEVKLSLCFDIACGIEALHRHGVVHCDIKPQNVLVRRRSGRNQPVTRCASEMEAGQVALKSLAGEGPFVAMLADFGGSIIMADQPGEKVHLRVFTPLWCAPECYSDMPIAKNLLPRVDIYSAGLVFAFVFLEGRDIFTQVVERGLMHQYDTTLDGETVRSRKTSGAALGLAVGHVRSFETSVFGITATGERLYLSREQMYPAVVSDIFVAILRLALRVDPSERVANATDLLEPWHRALQGDFHVGNLLHYSQPAVFRSFASGGLGGKGYFSRGKTCVRPDGHGCAQVPRLFSDSNTGTATSPGVFDIRKSFKVFRASLTSNLKTAILNDMLHEVELVRSISTQRQLLRLRRRAPETSGDVGELPRSQLQRAADCAYQVGVACLEGFGRSRDDTEALRWIKTAAEWDLHVAQAGCLPLSVSLGGDRPDKSDPSVQWAVEAIVNKHGHQGTVNALWEICQETCTDAVAKYRAERSNQIRAAFKQRTGEDWEKLCRGADWKAKLTQLHYSFLGFGGRLKTTADRGWSLLHYIVALAHGGLRWVILASKQLDILVDELGADVRALNDDSATALDLAMARGNMSSVRYLLDRHERCSPPFLPGSCPLQNVACLPESCISEIVERVCKIAPEIAVEGRISFAGRTALLNTLLTKEPLLPPARKAAVVSLLAHRANPLSTTAEPGSPSSLLLAVTGLEPELVVLMLLCVKRFGHGTPLLNHPTAARRPEPANELARAFVRLVKTPRSVSLVAGVVDYEKSLAAIVKTMLGDGVCAELPYVCRGMPHDLLGLSCYYGRDHVMQALLRETKGVGPAVAKTLGSGQASGIEALATAIECGFSEAADLLLPRLAKLPQVTAHTLLLTGAVHHQPALVPQLLSHFERAGRLVEVLEFQDQWGATILDLALEYGYFDLARHLLAKGATYDTYRIKGDHRIDEGSQSTLASVLPRIKPIKFLMELTPRPRLVVTSTGLNVFHALAADEKLFGTSAEFLQVLQYFHTLDPTLIHARGGAQGFTPFHLVSLHYAETVGSFLHAHGADINAVSAGGHTPLDLLHFHDDGGRGADEHLTIDYRTGGTPRTGVAICDFGMAGPVYWKLEARLSKRLMGLYETWGARRGLQSMMRRLGLQDDPMAAFWSGGITAYYEGSDGEERVSHFP